MTYYEPPFERGQGAFTRTLDLLVRFWWLTVPLTVLGVVAGAGLSTLAPTTYTAEVRLGVGGQTLDAQTVPGFVFASQELAATYARYVDDASSSGRLQEQVGVEAADSITEVSASPIPESSVIVIEVQGVVADDVQQAAQALAGALVEQVSGASPDEDAAAALAEFEELSTQVAQQQAALQSLQSDLGTLEAAPQVLPPAPAEVEALRAQIATAQAQQSVLSLRQEEAGDRYRELSAQNTAALSIVRDAEVVADDGLTRMLVWGVLGLAVGAGLALLGATLASRGAERGAQVQEDDGAQYDDEAQYDQAQYDDEVQHGDEVQRDDEVRYDDEVLEAGTPHPGAVQTPQRPE